MTDTGAKVAFYLSVSSHGLGLQQQRQQQMLWQFLLMMLQKREITCQHVRELLDLQSFNLLLSLFFFLSAFKLGTFLTRRGSSSGNFGDIK